MTYLSHQNGEHTSKTSRTLAILLLAHKENRDVEGLNSQLRKLAHIFVFCILTILSLATIYVWHMNQYIIYVIVLICIWAFVDEATKLWIQGRHFSLLDVGLNLIGMVIGLLFINFFS